MRFRSSVPSSGSSSVASDWGRSSWRFWRGGVDPRNTSKRCSTCGFTHNDNRHQESFKCSQCGYENHADYNASKNIGLQYLHRRQNADDGGAPVDVRLNRGTLNVSGEYVPPASVTA
nr:zinc ribbon domain-containing protein [Natrinema longum]